MTADNIHRGTIPCPVCGANPGHPHRGDAMATVRRDHVEANRPNPAQTPQPNRPSEEL